MDYDYRSWKIVVVVDETLAPGLAMNAVGHLSFSAGRYSDQSIMGQEKIVDADGNSHVGISKYPLIVLKSNAARIKEIVLSAKKQAIFVVDYPQEMFDTGADSELVEALAKAKEPLIHYRAVVLVGKSDDLTSLTQDLKLWR